jgi:hypothetical protein
MASKCVLALTSRLGDLRTSVFGWRVIASLQWRATIGVRFFAHMRFQRTVLSAAPGKHFT